MVENNQSYMHDMQNLFSHLAEATDFTWKFFSSSAWWQIELCSWYLLNNRKLKQITYSLCYYFPVWSRILFVLLLISKNTTWRPLHLPLRCALALPPKHFLEDESVIFGSNHANHGAAQSRDSSKWWILTKPIRSTMMSQGKELSCYFWVTNYCFNYWHNNLDPTWWECLLPVPSLMLFFKEDPAMVGFSTSANIQNNSGLVQMDLMSRLEATACHV